MPFPPPASDQASRTGRPRGLGAALVTVTVLALALSGCSDDAATTSSGGASAGSSAAPGGGRGGGQRQPGVSGLVAAAAGKTLQVQGDDGQTAVTWTSKTTFTSVAAATADALEAGVCVSVRSGTATPTSTEQIPATTVTVSQPVGGSCAAGFGGGGGARPSGAPSAMPSGMPSTVPSGAPSGQPGGRPGGGTNGTVASVDGSTFTVESSGPANGTGKTTVTVTTSADTTWEQVKTTTAKAATVGRCALAQGTADDTGALTATTIRISKPTSDGTCSTGRGAGGPGGGSPTAGAQGNG